MLGELVFSRLDPTDLANRDPEFIEAVAPLLNAARRWYFRMEAEGVEHLPVEGPFMAVGNHNGGPVMPDVWMILGWWAENVGTQRAAYAMVHDIVFKIPIVNNLLMKIGALPARPENAERALAAGATVLVYPGGELDCLRPFRDRNKIDFFDHAGFVKIAMRTGVPVVPIGNVGGHEVYFTLFSSRALARWTGIAWLTRVKTVPLTVGLPWGIWLGGFLPYLPLPAKLTYKVGEPIRFPHDPQLARNRDAVRRGYERVTTVLQNLVDDLARRRRFPVLG
jgi:1-acyl-sn-glycerol-3-phosphate acyltransferase